MDNLALIGKKIGMSREFFKTGQSVPVTVLKMETGRVINVIKKENRGYSAVQIGFGKIKNSKLKTQNKLCLEKEKHQLEKFILIQGFNLRQSQNSLTP